MAKAKPLLDGLLVVKEVRFVVTQSADARETPGHGVGYTHWVVNDAVAHGDGGDGTMLFFVVEATCS